MGNFVRTLPLIGQDNTEWWHGQIAKAYGMDIFAEHEKNQKKIASLESELQQCRFGFEETVNAMSRELIETKATILTMQREYEVQLKTLQSQMTTMMLQFNGSGGGNNAKALGLLAINEGNEEAGGD